MKKPVPPRQRCSNQRIALVKELKDGMEEKGYQVEGQQKIGKILFAVAKIMFEIISLCFQRVVVFVLYLPP